MTAIASEPTAAADPPSEAFLRLIPRDFARQHLVLSAGTRDGVERLLVSERSNPAAVFNVGVRLGTPIETEINPDEELARRIDEAYGAARQETSDTPAAAEVETDVE
ncbi:MAG: hypothetical protein K8E66_13860, partial [Phycisphaerales bacterium]|nr:hypothetical protein [Phycisphaerales bacterium]